MLLNPQIYKPSHTQDIPHPFNDRDGYYNGYIELHEEVARTVWECRMFELSWTLRRKHNWYEMIKDSTIMSKWRSEALEQQVNEVPEWRLTPNMVDYVLNELESYANLRDAETGIEHACDDAIFWSRSLIPQELTAALLGEVTKLEDIPDDQKDWHPNSNRQVLNLVDPSLYPIVYGRTYVRDPNYAKEIDVITAPLRGECAPTCCTSAKFSWLPSDFCIGVDGVAKLASPYINNIHPSSADLMDTIGSIISRFVPLWERVIGSIDRSERPERNMGSIDPKKRTSISARIPGASTECLFPDGYIEDRLLDDKYEESEYLEWPGEDKEERRLNWLRARIIPRHGEESSSSQDIKLSDALPPSQFVSVVKENWRVADLRNRMLQVIVKLVNIQLTPDQPDYAGGSWHVEGMLNERIAATGIYYYDSKNITDSHLSFQCCIQAPHDHHQDDFTCMKWLYNLDRYGYLVQARGQFPTDQGNCLAFPNIYQHRVSPFTLADPTKPGHRKILALFLVDPTHPIPSATTVPLQRQDWVKENVRRCINATGEHHSYMDKLPVELKEVIIEKMDGLISWEEAVKIREELVKERKQFTREYQDGVVSVEFDMCDS